MKRLLSILIMISLLGLVTIVFAEEAKIVPAAPAVVEQTPPAVSAVP